MPPAERRLVLLPVAVEARLLTVLRAGLAILFDNRAVGQKYESELL